jgi:cephalosporin-C deacetylase
MGRMFDMPLSQLRTYKPEVEEPADFDAFWSSQLSEAARHWSPPVFEELADGPRHATVWDVTFSGHGGTPVKGWLSVPHRGTASAPVVVEYIGYNGGRGDPYEWLNWPSAGYPHFVMDSRGQGGGGRRAHTADPGATGEPSVAGKMTSGILSPSTYYFTRLFVDAALAVRAARSHPALEERKVVVTGGSQGGGLALAATSLVGDVAASLPDVPFLAHARRALEVVSTLPYNELAAYCRVYPDRVGTVFSTFSYVDVVNHAKRATAPALFSVGLLDEITPASTVFTAYNHYRGEKQIEVYEYNGHEGGGVNQFRRKLEYLAGAGLA